MESKRHPVSTWPMSTASARGLYSIDPTPTGPQTVTAAATSGRNPGSSEHDWTERGRGGCHLHTTWSACRAARIQPRRGSLTSIAQGAASKAARRSPGSQAASCFFPKELSLERQMLPARCSLARGRPASHGNRGPLSLGWLFLTPSPQTANMVKE